MGGIPGGFFCEGGGYQSTTGGEIISHGCCTRGFFFDAAMSPGAVGSQGKGFPMIATPGIFFDAAGWAWASWKARIKVFPTIAAPGSPPDQANMLVCHPESCRSPIPAIHLYLEYPVGLFAGSWPLSRALDRPGRKI